MSNTFNIYQGSRYPPRPTRLCLCLRPSDRCIIIVAIHVIIFGFSLWVYALVLWNTPIMFTITGASLNQYNISSSHQNLHNNLFMNLTKRNSNKHFDLYYERIVITTLYQGQRLGSTAVEPFYHKAKNTVNLDDIVLYGQSYVLRDHKDVFVYDQGSSFGMQDIDVYIEPFIRFKVPIFKTIYLTNYRFQCGFKVPLSVDGNQTSYCGTSCHWPSSH